MNGNEEIDFTLRQLRTALQPLYQSELKADLWPRMLRRMEETSGGFGWAEAVVVGLIGLALAIFPELVPMMLYNL